MKRSPSAKHQLLCPSFPDSYLLRHHFVRRPRKTLTAMLASPSSHPAFAPLRAVLYFALTVPLLTGLLGLRFSVLFVHNTSHSLSPATLVDPFLNSQWRFICAMWLCYAPILYTIICNPPRYAPILRIISAFVAIGGLGRCYTALTLGWPEHINAKTVAVSAIGLEFLMPVLFWTLLDRGLKESGAKEN